MSRLRSILPVHVRPRSETLPSTEATCPYTKSRARAASTAGPPRFQRRPPRSRLASLVSTPSLAPAVLHVPQDEPETIGSFAPTNPPSLKLRTLLHPGPSLPLAMRAFRRPRPDSPNDETWLGEDSGSALRHSPSPPDSPDIPSICRTPSSYTESDYFPTAPSSAGPATPAREFSPSPIHGHKPLPLHPVLELLEDQSKFCVRTACAHCRKVGNNFPCCPRCGEMWCSRDCRMQSNGGKRHTCKKN
ncbi:hypothetical protein FOMPIDRAFT_1057522 [Fomitopsis schrenkii]|uniref:Uncharacterized protein n=1 Tax=Fomitopsis schrenkii TaxID=2126942 RepID=S8EM57_FOMSC|nr:hypothetical protein FOMPIDRAFT_1057522 [Fomitopsis schrenkii]